MDNRIKYTFEKFSQPGELRDMEDYTQLDDPVLSENIDTYMKARMDLEEIMKDASLEQIRLDTKVSVDSYVKSGRRDTANLNYLKESLNELAEERKIKAEINEIRKEAALSMENKSADWVADYNRRKNQEKDPAWEERKNFITESLKTNDTGEESIVEKPAKRKFLSRYATLAAAAVIAAMLLIKTLATSSDPEKMFKSYYEPFTTMSPVTRGNSNDSENPYNSGIEFYRAGNYTAAKDAFSKAAEINVNYGSPEFMLGITDLETGDYEDAIQKLSSAVNISGQYSKEAKWYLGMAYLRTGNVQKARELFETLAKSNGFYKERSQDILRRLK